MVIRIGCFALLISCPCLLPSVDAAEGDKQGQKSSRNKNEKAKTSDSLDLQLLDDLDNQLLEGLGDLPDKPAKKKRTDKNPLDQRGEGEDVGVEKSVDPLTLIGQKMRTAGELISLRGASSKTQQLQQQILEELSALITAAQKQRQTAGNRNASNRRGSGNSEEKPDKSATDSPPKDKESGQQSTDRLGKNDKERALALIQGPRSLLKEFWGDLPVQVRQQMQSVSAEHFLPKYEKLIQQYYKRLAEEGGNRP